MAGRNRHTPEQIIRKLRQGDELAAKGTDVEEIARQLDVSVPTLYNWRKQYGGMKADDAKEFKELKNENALLKRLLAEAELEKAALKEIAKGKLNRAGFLAAPMLATSPAGESIVESNRWPRTRRE